MRHIVDRRLSLVVAAASAATIAASFPVLAQTDETVLERVEVTGSRIKKAEIEGQTPVLTLTAEDLRASGLTSVGDVIQRLTGSGSALNTRFNSSGNFGFPPDGGGVGAGSTTVDLRHLGAKRVLVLVDGLRWVNEASASGVSAATDLNTIPMSIIDRIEVLEDGASSIYGSDAIAGVVNIITKKDVDGGSVSMQYGEYDEGDGETSSVEASFGATGERYSFFLSASWFDQKRISSADREISRFPIPGTGLAGGSSGTPNGRFIFLPPSASGVCPLTDLDGNPDTPPVPFCNITTPNGSSFPNNPQYPDDFIPFTTDNRYNFSPNNFLLTPNKRKGIYAQTRFAFTDNISGYFRFLYNNRQSINQAAPEPIFLGPDAGTGNPLADNIFISASNPYNPFGIDLISSGAGANLILIGRRPVEGGPRIFEQDVDTWYAAAGLEGDFNVGTRYWFWDVNFARSQNEARQTTYGSYNIRRIAMGLGPLDACQADPQCVPVNIFGGPGTLTPEMLAYIQPILTDRSDNNLSLWSANLSGDLFDLPSGPVAFATGFEHRKLDGFYMPDALIVAGDSNGVPSSPTSGEYDVNEYFLEFNVPLLAERPGFKRLDLSLAGRYSDYSTFGGETTLKGGLRWQFNDEFLLRGTWAEGFRAPSIGELFGSASRFDAQINDPCSQPSDPTTIANCAALGVPPSFEQPNPQISVVTGGNPDLDPERVDSISTGIVYSPLWAEGLGWSERIDLELGYYRHDLEGAIQAIDAQTQLNRCVETLDPAFCDGIGRASTGGINNFQNRLTNLGRIKTSGYDLKVNWLSPEWSWGQLSAAWLTTYVKDYTATDAAGNVEPRQVGIEVNDSAIPEWTSNLLLGWQTGPWSAGWTIRHIDTLTESCGDIAVNFPVCRDQQNGLNKLGATTYHDAQLTWRTDQWKGLSLTGGVNNLFDKDAPTCLSCSLNGYDASNYDLPGRYWYVRAQLDF